MPVGIQRLQLQGHVKAGQRLPVAQALGEDSLMFLVHPTLTPAEIQKTCEVVRAVLAEAGA